jgi:anti-sigma factor RsiW
MTPSDDTAWEPSPELLAAYFDGELDARDDAAVLRERLEAWLRRHPEAREELAAYRRLARLWHQTTPPEPSPETWQDVRARLHPAPQARPRRPIAVRRWAAALTAAAALVGLVAWYWAGRGQVPDVPSAQFAQPKAAPAEDMTPFPVATGDEVTILRVEGADTGTLVVGQLPVYGPLELAGPGDVDLTSVQPDLRDNMVPHVRLQWPHRPMIWAKLETEDMDP